MTSYLTYRCDDSDAKEDGVVVVPVVAGSRDIAADEGDTILVGVG